MAHAVQCRAVVNRQMAVIVDVVGDPFSPGRMLDYIGIAFGVVGPILFAVLIAALPFWLRLPGDAHDDARVALGAFCYPIIVLLVVQALLSRANANWTAAASVAATVYVSLVIARGSARDRMCQKRMIT